MATQDHTPPIVSFPAMRGCTGGAFRALRPEVLPFLRHASAAVNWRVEFSGLRADLVAAGIVAPHLLELTVKGRTQLRLDEYGNEVQLTRRAGDHWDVAVYVDNIVHDDAADDDASSTERLFRWAARRPAWRPHVKAAIAEVDDVLARLASRA